MTILLQNHTKSLSEVNIFSPIASFSSSALQFIATFVFSNDSNITNKPLHFGLSIEHQNFTMLRIGLKVERKTHEAQSGMIESFVLKYEMTDGNKDNKMVVENITYTVYPEKKSSFSLTISFRIHMNLLQKKFNVIGNLIDMNQTKVIDHSATVGLTKSFVTEHKTQGKEKFYLFISKRNVSSTQRIGIQNISQTNNYTG